MNNKRDELVSAFADALEKGTVPDDLADEFVRAFLEATDEESEAMLAGALGLSPEEYKRERESLPPALKAKQERISDIFAAYMGMPGAGIAELQQALKLIARIALAKRDVAGFLRSLPRPDPDRMH